LTLILGRWTGNPGCLTNKSRGERDGGGAVVIYTSNFNESRCFTWRRYKGWNNKLPRGQSKAVGGEEARGWEKLVLNQKGKGGCY